MAANVNKMLRGGGRKKPLFCLVLLFSTVLSGCDSGVSFNTSLTSSASEFVMHGDEVGRSDTVEVDYYPGWEDITHSWSRRYTAPFTVQEANRDSVDYSDTLTDEEYSYPYDEHPYQIAAFTPQAGARYCASTGGRLPNYTEMVELIAHGPKVNVSWPTKHAYLINNGNKTTPHYQVIDLDAPSATEPPIANKSYMLTCLVGSFKGMHARAVPDGKDVAQVRFTLIDNDNKPVSNQLVNITIVSRDGPNAPNTAAIAPASVITTSQGIAKVNMSNQVEENIWVTAEYQGEIQTTMAHFWWPFL